MLETPQPIYDMDFYHTSADQGRIFVKFVESIAALCALGLGVQFIATGYTAFVPVFVPMDLVAPAWVWGLGMVSLGLLRLMTVFVNGWWPHSHLARKWFSVLFLFIVWLPLMACYLWNFFLDFTGNNYRTYPGLAYSMLTTGIELLIFYAHATFVYVALARKANG